MMNSSVSPDSQVTTETSRHCQCQVPKWTFDEHGTCRCGNLLPREHLVDLLFNYDAKVRRLAKENVRVSIDHMKCSQTLRSVVVACVDFSKSDRSDGELTKLSESVHAAVSESNRDHCM